MWKKNGHSRFSGNFMVHTTYLSHSTYFLYFLRQINCLLFTFSGNRGCGRNEPHHRRRQSIHVSHGLTSEEESDYAYIDRSTHR